MESKPCGENRALHRRAAAAAQQQSPRRFRKYNKINGLLYQKAVFRHIYERVLPYNALSTMMPGIWPAAASA
jgi:hypothetical protein